MDKLRTTAPDYFPLNGAYTLLAPYNQYGGIDWDRQISTIQAIAGDVGIAQNIESQTIPNSRGDDLTINTSRTFTITLALNVWNEVFHNALTGVLTSVESTAAMMVTKQAICEKDNTDYLINLEYKPVEFRGKIRVSVWDAYENRLEEITDSEPLGPNQYSVDAENKKIMFSEDSENKSFNIVYYREGIDVYVAKTNPNIINNFFYMGMTDTVQTTTGGIIYNRFTEFEKITISGDINEQARGKNPNSPVTYTFKTAPIPAGQSACKIMMDQIAA